MDAPKRHDTNGIHGDHDYCDQVEQTGAQIQTQQQAAHHEGRQQTQADVEESLWHNRQVLLVKHVSHPTRRKEILAINDLFNANYHVNNWQQSCRSDNTSYTELYIRVRKYFKVRGGAFYIPHAHCDVVRQLSGLQQCGGELLRVGQRHVVSHEASGWGARGTKGSTAPFPFKDQEIFWALLDGDIPIISPLGSLTTALS